MEVHKKYILWNSEIAKCSGMVSRAVAPKIRVYSEGQHTVVLVSKGMRYDIEAELDAVYRAENCMVLQLGWGENSGVLVFTEHGPDLFWSSLFQKWISVDNTQIVYKQSRVATMERASEQVLVTTVNGELRAINCSEIEFESSISELKLAEVVEEDESESSRGLRVWDWVKGHPGLSVFCGSLVVIGIVLSLIYLTVLYKPKSPIDDPFIYQPDTWEFPEAREHPYPEFAFLDKYDKDDEYGVATKEGAPVPRTLSEAKKLNEDVKGWVKVPGTAVSYPVLLTDMGNSYYLNRNILKQQVFSGNTDGVIFADTKNSLDSRDTLSKNTVIYGHNWTNRENGETARVNNPEDKQFAPLISFSNHSFAQKYRRIVLTTDDGAEQQFAIFAAFYMDIAGSEFFQYNEVNPSEEGFTEFIKKAKAASLYEYPVNVAATDKIITLSTCSVRYSKTGSGRFVVMGKLVGSKADIPTSTLKVKEG